VELRESEMAEIQRYEPQHVLTAPLGMMRADDEGEYVLHAAHLAEMAKKDREIEQLRSDTCGAVYAEYVNGCPKCWHGDPPRFPEPEVRSGVRAVKINDPEQAA
jgi:hypothetical protein